MDTPRIEISASILNLEPALAMTRSAEWILGNLDNQGLPRVLITPLVNINPGNLTRGGLGMAIAKRGGASGVHQSWLSERARDLPRIARDRGIGSALQVGKLITGLPHIEDSWMYTEPILEAYPHLDEIIHPNESLRQDAGRWHIDYQPPKPGRSVLYQPTAATMIDQLISLKKPIVAAEQVETLFGQMKVNGIAADLRWLIADSQLRGHNVRMDDPQGFLVAAVKRGIVRRVQVNYPGDPRLSDPRIVQAELIGAYNGEFESTPMGQMLTAALRAGFTGIVDLEMQSAVAKAAADKAGIKYSNSFELQGRIAEQIHRVAANA